MGHSEKNGFSLELMLVEALGDTWETPLHPKAETEHQEATRQAPLPWQGAGRIGAVIPFALLESKVRVRAQGLGMLLRFVGLKVQGTGFWGQPPGCRVWGSRPQGLGLRI